ncbi:MAG: hypothetical protein AB9872_15405 [Solidesulfovibrio sp.]
MEPENMQQPEVAKAQNPGVAGLEPTLADLENHLDALVDARLEAVLVRRRQSEREVQTERFAAENPDFRELLTSGALDAQKRDNPLLDDVGAYFAHRLMAERKAADETVAKARAEAESEAEARTLERFRTKRLAQTMNAGLVGAGRGQGGDPELGAPEKFGGLNAVLAARLKSRRQAAGN